MDGLNGFSMIQPLIAKSPRVRNWYKNGPSRWPEAQKKSGPNTEGRAPLAAPLCETGPTAASLVRRRQR